MCVYQPPAPEPTRAEKALAELKGYAAQRKAFGFRSDLAYVRKLIKAGQWESDVGFIPVTKREDEYLQLRDSLTLGTAGNRYLRPRRDQYGGASIEDGWPRAPYLLVRFTKDVQRHLAALKRVARFPDNLRAKRVRYSERTLDRARDRVSDDIEQLAKVGFHVQTSSYDTDKGVAEIELVTKRTDTRAYFAKRYGKLVRPIVTGTETTELECAPATAFKIEPDGRSIRPRYESGGGAEYERTEVTEFPDRVEIGVVERAPTGPRTLDLRIGYAPSTTLSAPLGDRPVIDTRTGKRLPLRGPAPGDPPCPPRPQAAAARAADAQQSDVERLAERISADARVGDGFLDGYGRAGFAVAGMRVTRQTVVVQLYTTRQDHAAWFTARYGPAVRTEVIGDRYECVGDFE